MDETPKSKLSDVVGALVSSVAHARSVADMSALRIASQYRQSDLLKGLPVPRLRIQRVNISFPVIISDVISGKEAEKSATSKIVKDVSEELQNIIQHEKASIAVAENLQNLTDDEKRHFFRLKDIFDNDKIKELIYKFEGMYQNRLDHAYLHLNVKTVGYTSADVLIRETSANVAENVFREIMQEIIFGYAMERTKKEKFDPDRARKSARKLLDHPLIEKIIEEIRHKAEYYAIITPTEPPDLYVYVDTDRIKTEGGGPHSITRFNIALLEEGLEWVTESQSGAEHTKLMPE